MRLTDILYVTDNAIINRITFGFQFAIIMPAGVAVSVETLANDRTSYVRIAIQRKISARRINRSRKVSGGSDRDGLGRVWIRWTDSVILKIRGVAAFVINVARLYVHIAVKKDLQMHLRLYVYFFSYVVRHVNGHVSFVGSIWIDDQLAGERGKQIESWRLGGPGSGRRESIGVNDAGGRWLREREIGWHLVRRDRERHVVIDRSSNLGRTNNGSAIRCHVPIKHPPDGGDRAIDLNTSAAGIGIMRIRHIVGAKIVRAIR